MTQRIDHIEVSKAVKDKLKDEAKRNGRSLRKQVAHILELHAEGDNGIYRALHPVKKKNP